MRLWHKDLLSVLPRKQLLSQWRECCCIAKNIADNGTPNHPLVNVMLSYSAKEFLNYADNVVASMKHRGYKVSFTSYEKFQLNMIDCYEYFNNDRHTCDLYEDWHNDRYYMQCYYNLQEKYDRGMISNEEWQLIETRRSY